MENLKFALYLLVALVPALVLHEYAHAFIADRLGDPTPRRWGRLTFNPKQLADPFGTVILPALILLLVAAGRAFLPLFAYAKPMPLDSSYLRDRDRDGLLITLAGPAANLALAAAAGALLRAGLSGDAALLVFAFLYVNLIMLVFSLMPVPGLDGSKILARFLHPRAREVYTNLDHYLTLFMLAIFFLFGGLLLGIVGGLSGGLCNLVASPSNCQGLF